MFHPSKSMMGPPGDEASARPATRCIIHDSTGQCVWLCVCLWVCVWDREEAFVGVTEWSDHFVAWLCFRSAVSCLVVYCLAKPSLFAQVIVVVEKNFFFKIANHTVDQGALFCCQIYCISVVFCARTRQNLKSFWQRRKTVWFVVNCHRRITVQGSLVVLFYRLYWRGYWETFIIYYIFLLTIFLHIMNQTRDKSSVKQTRTPNRGPCSCCVLNISLKYLVFDIL